MPDNYVMLCPQKNFQGSWNNFTSSQPVLAPGIDELAQSLGVHPAAPPVAFYDGQNFSGASFVVTRFGSILDLSNPPIPIGNWANRIRSFRYLHSADLDQAIGTGTHTYDLRGDLAEMPLADPSDAQLPHAHGGYVSRTSRGLATITDACSCSCVCFTGVIGASVIAYNKCTGPRTFKIQWSDGSIWTYHVGAHASLTIALQSSSGCIIDDYPGLDLNASDVSFVKTTPEIRAILHLIESIAPGAISERHLIPYRALEVLDAYSKEVNGRDCKVRAIYVCQSCYTDDQPGNYVITDCGPQCWAC